ncbi:flavonoid 3'-monooxygenase-like [Forsythia ovata]|uniref:Flavonoid 3'-monooxygenase-like n=1 Tax=Forsythia ovata TaxID=205694 RepID=A0ABD1U5G1_9LAMI
MTRMVLSNKYFSEPKCDLEGSIITLDELQEMLDQWFFLNGVINIGDWIPWLCILDMQGYVKQMKDLYKKFDRFHEYVLDDHKAKRDALDKDFVPKDMVDVLLLLSENPNLEVKLTRDCVKGLMQVHHIMFGYSVSKGTTVLVNVWSIGRNPKYWDAPEEYLPGRFLDKKIDILGQNFALLPFGSGRRRCPGYKLGLKIVHSALANLLHGFKWKLLKTMKPEDVCMEEHYGLTTHPKVPLEMIIEPRLPIHLY